MSRAQLSFTCSEELTAKIDAEMQALGYATRSEVVRHILVRHFEAKEEEARKQPTAGGYARGSGGTKS